MQYEQKRKIDYICMLGYISGQKEKKKQKATAGGQNHPHISCGTSLPDGKEVINRFKRTTIYVLHL